MIRVSIVLAVAGALFSCVEVREKTVTYRNGEMREQYSYSVDDMGIEYKNGPWTKWFPDGSLREQSHWLDGERHGVWTKWYENGDKKEESKWFYGSKDGRHVWLGLGGDTIKYEQWREGTQIQYALRTEGAMVFSPDTIACSMGKDADSEGEMEFNSETDMLVVASIIKKNNLEKVYQVEDVVTTDENFRIVSLNLSNAGLNVLPPEIGRLRELSTLTLSRNSLKRLPSELQCLKKLRYMDVSRNHIALLPSQIGNLTGLKMLNLDQNVLTELPATLGNLKQLRTLSLTRNKLARLPQEIGNLDELRELDLSFNALRDIPTQATNLFSLRKLNLSMNLLTQLPEEIIKISPRVYVEKNYLCELTPEIGDWVTRHRGGDVWLQSQRCGQEYQKLLAEPPPAEDISVTMEIPEVQ